MWVHGVTPIKAKQGDIIGYQGECDNPFIILNPNKNAKGRELPGYDLGKSPVSTPCTVSNNQLIFLSDGIRLAHLKMINGLWHYQRIGVKNPIEQLVPNTYFEIGGKK